MGDNTKSYIVTWSVYSPPVGTLTGYRLHYVEGTGVTNLSPKLDYIRPMPGLTLEQYDISKIDAFREDAFSCEIGVFPIVDDVVDESGGWHYKQAHDLTSLYTSGEKWDIWIIDPRLQLGPADVRFCDRASFTDLKLPTTATRDQIQDACEAYWGGDWPYVSEGGGSYFAPNDLDDHIYAETRRSERAEGRLDKEFMFYIGMNAVQAERDHISPERVIV